MPEALPGSAFEADLRALREDRSLSVSDIERATRVPADVVRRFEEGALMRDPDYSVVYLRAFVKAYAEALDLSASRTNAAFDAARQGQYRGELREGLGAPVEPPADTAQDRSSSPGLPAAPPKKPAPPPQHQEPPPEEAEADDAPPVAPGAAPAVAALSKGAPKERKPHTPEPTARRSGPPSRVSSNDRRSWGLLVGIGVFSVAALAIVLVLIFRNPEPDLEPVATAPASDTTAAADTAAAEPAIPPPPQVGDSIRVTLIAADGPLQGFRVEAEPDVRRPYWLEQGVEQTFVSPTQVTVWGTETAGGWQISPEARLRIAGLTWAPRDSVRLDRARAQALVDSLHRAQYES